MTEEPRVPTSVGEGQITFECPDCGRTLLVDREFNDPPGAAKARLQCDRCDDNDRHSPEYYDADGKWIDPMQHILGYKS